MFAFREMGKGLEVIANFCQIINMLRSFTQTAYNQCLDELHRSIQAEANDSLQKVAEKTYAENRSGDNEMIQQIALFHLMDRGRHVVLLPLMVW